MTGMLTLAPGLAAASSTAPQPGPLPDAATQAETAPSDTAGDLDAQDAPIVQLVDPTKAPRYALTNLGQATTAKIQKPWGACWAFAVAGAIESAILKAQAEGAGELQTETAEDSPAFDAPILADLPSSPDISERAMAWFAHEAQTEASAQSQAGEGFSLITPSAEEQLSGGNFATAASALTAWQTLVSEKTAPYEYNGYVPGESFGWYSSNPAYDARFEDWSLPDEVRLMEDVGWRVSEVLRLKSPSMLTDAGTYAGYDAEATETIKRTLVNVGGVAVALSMEQSIPADVWAGDYLDAEPSESFTFSTWSQYSADAQPTQNHAAVILGWDDAYPASAFAGTTSGQPPADGAWLCKNSWGNDALFENLGGSEDAIRWGLLDANGQASGYFWLSYYDHAIADLEAFAVTPASESCERLYQYDYVGAAEYVTPVKYTGRVLAANVFTAEDTELLKAVTGWTFAPETACAVTVGVLPAGFDTASATPDELMAASTPLAHAQGVFADAGFHTMDLDAPVLVTAGQAFTLALEISAEPDALAEGRIADDADTYLGLEVAYLDAGTAGQTTSASTVANEGETFVSVDGATWRTIVDFNAERNALREQYGKEPDFVYGNAITKALANPTTMADPGFIYEVVPLS